MCEAEFTHIAWTASLLARRHKSWKHHYGVRLRATVDHPIRRSLHNDVVPRLLDEARARGYTSTLLPHVVCILRTTP
jgi:hypothetical protein